MYVLAVKLVLPIFQHLKNSISPRVFLISLLIALVSRLSYHYFSHRTNKGQNSSFEELLRPPRCNLTSRDALSAIQRAKTVRCKNEMAEFACKLQDGLIYPESLPRYTEKFAEHFEIPPRPVQILFVLTIHGRDNRQILRLLKLIYRRNYYFVIHVDARSAYLFDQLRPLEDTFHNIRLLRQRRSPIWGGASLLTTLLDAMRYALTQDGWQWDYLINLSESDLPIKSGDALVAYLTDNYGKNFAKSHGTETDKFIKRQGLDKTFYQCEDRMWRLGSRHLPSGIIIDGGSDWIALHRSFCQYLVKDPPNQLIRGLLVVFNHTLLPAESFFHTVLQNSEFSSTFINNNLRLTNWKRKKGCNCQYRHIVDWCGCSPNVFRSGDSYRIESFTSKPIFFARKFDPVVDLSIVNANLLEFVSGEETDPSWNTHWLNLYTHTEPFPSWETRSLYGSLTRLAIDQLGLQRKLVKSQLQDVFLQVNIDGTRNLLVTQNVESPKSTFTVEARFGFRRYFRMENIGKNAVAMRLLDMQISSDYDLKEDVFRNYCDILGPYSEPALAILATAGNNTVTSVVWLDPADVVAGSFEVNITEEAGWSLHQPGFTAPLRPGIWRVLMMHNWKLVAQTKFLVIPVYKAPLHITNAGPAHDEYIRYNFSSVARLLKLNATEKVVQSRIHAEQMETDGEAWIDGLVGEFYLLEGVCGVGKVEEMEMSKCHDVEWSSYFPDAKTQIVPAG